MTSKDVVDGFVAQESLALVGASRGGKKFGNTVLRELAGKGYRMSVVHPEASEIDGVPCCRSVAELPGEGIYEVGDSYHDDLVEGTAEVGPEQVVIAYTDPEGNQWEVVYDIVERSEGW